ncbi:hypothetical protein AGMMS50284_0930 [Clostridia bacterium]|nr:hypothetical protein AGMMS50284_0930 [Clostridia bacterium]
MQKNKPFEIVTTITAKSFLEILAKEKINSNELQDLLVAALAEGKMKIATAESCTGGLISAKITQVPGSSAVFDCGICSYGNNIKENVLGVSNAVLSSVGAVSAETAAAMASGVRLLAKSDIGISTTGIAGPSGGSDEKPVGLVYIACSTQKSTAVYKCLLKGNNNNREQIRELAVQIALYAALRFRG